MPLKITVIRHGNTDANNERWIQGQLDTLLNENGQNQAKKCGQRLQNEVYDHVYCSDLTRCKQTLNAILEYHSNVQVDYLPTLREKDFGKLAGQSIRKLYIDASTQKLDIEEYVANHGGESDKVFQERVHAAWEYIVNDASNNNYQSILVVTHGGVIHDFSIYWALHGYKPTKEGMVPESLIQGNTAVSIVDPTTKLIYEFNSTTHLGEQDAASQPPPAV